MVFVVSIWPVLDSEEKEERFINTGRLWYSPGEKSRDQIDQTWPAKLSAADLRRAKMDGKSEKSFQTS